MKILLVNKFFYPKGGAETVLFQERDYLMQHGHAVSEFSMHHQQNIVSPYTEYFVKNIDYRGKTTIGNLIKYPLIAAKFIRNGDAILKLKKLLKKHKPEIAHLHNVYHQLTPSIIPVLKDHGLKVFLTLHDYKIICPNYKMLRHGTICSACQNGKYLNCLVHRCEDNSLFKSLLLMLESFWHRTFKSYEGVDLFIAPSKFLANQVIENGLPPEKVRLLLNGINHNEIVASCDDKGYILYFGRISKEKGIPTLLRAYAKSRTTLSLKIVGNGPLLEEIRQQYNNIEFLNYKSGDALHALISAASFVIVPSEWYENCSMSVLEAMAHGKPVIGARIGGIPEQIEHRKSGFLFEMGNENELAEQINILSEDIDLRRQFSARARQKLIDEYSLERHCIGLTSLYKESLSM